jgi:hypothetical protein
MAVRRGAATNTIVWSFTTADGRTKLKRHHVANVLRRAAIDVCDGHD